MNIYLRLNKLRLKSMWALIAFAHFCFGLALLLTFPTGLAQEKSTQKNCQVYCLDTREYIRLLVEKVGIEEAQSAPTLACGFPDFESCEAYRKSMLPYDSNWQRLTKCVCGKEGDGSEAGSDPSDLSLALTSFDRHRRELRLNYGEEAEKEFEKMVAKLLESRVQASDFEKIVQIYFEDISATYQRNKYLKAQEQQKKEANERFARDKEDLLRDIRVSTPPGTTKQSGVGVSGGQKTQDSTAAASTSSVSNKPGTGAKSPPQLTSGSAGQNFGFSINYALLEASAQKPVVDGRMGEVALRIARWNWEEIKSVLVDLVTEETGWPVDRVSKAFGVSKLMNMAVVEPVMKLLDEVKEAIDKPNRWAELSSRSFRQVEETEETVSQEAKFTVLVEFVEQLPAGKFLGKFLSAFKESKETGEKIR